jgi:hypothetical protein
MRPAIPPDEREDRLSSELSNDARTAAAEDARIAISFAALSRGPRGGRRAAPNEQTRDEGEQEEQLRLDAADHAS